MATGRRRKALAKAELWMLIAVHAEKLARGLRGEQDGLMPPEKWPADDPLIALCRTYELTHADLADIITRVAGQAETKALQSGYDDHWDDPKGDR